MMGKITRNRDVAVVDRLTAKCSQARKQLSLPIGLGIIFIAREQ